MNINPKKHFVLVKGEDKTASIESLLKTNNGYRVTYIGSDKSYPYSAKDISIKPAVLSDNDAGNKFTYLKQIADFVSMVGENNNKILSEKYNKLVINPNSVLAKYLHIDTIKKSTRPDLIYPFGFNLSQKQAVQKAFENDISIIEGPPGTGKTQTILNIIANAILNNKTVAVVSNNNAATANVSEKLEKYGVDFIVASLGNSDNKDKFFSEQDGKYPDFSTWKTENTATNLQEKEQELDELLAQQNQLSKSKQELSELALEKRYFDDFYTKTVIKIPKHFFQKYNSATILKCWIDYQATMDKFRKIGFFHKLKNFIFYGIRFAFYKNPSVDIIYSLQKFYYQYKEKEIETNISQLENQLKNFSFDATIKQYSDDSMAFFKAKLNDRFSQKAVREKFDDTVLWNGDFQRFIKEYPVVLSTTQSLASSAKKNYLFDYVIMDEASQVDIVTGALAFSSAKNVVIVGDLKQLPHIVSHDKTKETNDIFHKHKINEAYNYVENSILLSVKKLFANIPTTLLKEHYRCHPKIIGFCNQKFYDNQLIILTKETAAEKPLILRKTVKGNHARGAFNQRQIDEIKNILKEFPEDDIGIISPFREQTDRAIETFQYADIEIDTVHKYQGREKNTIIFTTVLNKIEKDSFVDNPNLINVAISRAVKKLIVIINGNEDDNKSNINDLVKYIEYNNFEVTQSYVRSIFDLLYQGYSTQLSEFRKNHKNMSDYDSENLMNALIEKVLPEFNNLNKIMHQPLRMLIKNPTKLDNDEYKFAMNPWTHIDFLVFNKMNKMPILAIEVDGYKFHANSPKQSKRDKMKDAILKKYGISVLRFATNESNEEARLKNRLNELTKQNIK